MAMAQEVVQTMPGDGDVLGDQVAPNPGDFWFAPSCYTDRLMPGKVVEREDIKKPAVQAGRVMGETSNYHHPSTTGSASRT